MGKRDAVMSVKLASMDGQEVEVDKEVACMSNTIKNMMDDISTEEGNPVLLPNVTGKILTKVIQYCQYHHDNPSQDDDDDHKERRTDDITPWDQEFCNVDQATLFEMILAANFL